MAENNGPRVLIAGETWVSYGMHMKGFNQFSTGTYAEGLTELVAALRERGHEVTHIPNHLAATHFPANEEGLSSYDVVVLSDIGSDTLLLHPDTFDRGLRTPNRLRALAEWVRSGGALLMVGGYMSFTGFEGKARYGMTPLADVLPALMLPYDDRVETPEGVHPQPASEHAILRGLATTWPYFLGYQRFAAKPGAETLMTVEGDPFLVVDTHGEGRAAAFASDCSPHWGSPDFIAWPQYGAFWGQLIEWLATGT